MKIYRDVPLITCKFAQICFHNVVYVRRKEVGKQSRVLSGRLGGTDYNIYAENWMLDRL